MSYVNGTFGADNVHVCYLVGSVNESKILTFAPTVQSLGGV